MTTSETPIRLLLVDDHPLVLDGVNACLEEEPGMQVVGQAANGSEALALAAEIDPDVVLMDVTMPVMGGLEAATLFRERFPAIRILILSMHDDQAYILKLIQAGASGYILKDVSSAELIKAIETVHQGSTYFSAGASESLFKNFDGQSRREKRVLTRREETVLRMIAEGLCNKDVARQLDISVRTVESHRQNIKSKLKVSTAAGLAKYAIENDLVK